MAAIILCRGTIRCEGFRVCDDFSKIRPRNKMTAVHAMARAGPGNGYPRRRCWPRSGNHFGSRYWKSPRDANVIIQGNFLGSVLAFLNKKIRQGKANPAQSRCAHCLRLNYKPVAQTPDCYNSLFLNNDPRKGVKKDPTCRSVGSPRKSAG